MERVNLLKDSLNIDGRESPHVKVIKVQEEIWPVEGSDVRAHRPTGHIAMSHKELTALICKAYLSNVMHYFVIGAQVTGRGNPKQFGAHQGAPTADLADIVEMQLIDIAKTEPSAFTGID